MDNFYFPIFQENCTTYRTPSFREKERALPLKRNANDFDTVDESDLDESSPQFYRLLEAISLKNSLFSVATQRKIPKRLTSNGAHPV